MRVRGDFLFLGIEDSPESSDKVWHRIGLPQGLHSQVFYISDAVLLSKIRTLDLELGQAVTAELSISESKGKTYFSILNIEKN